jgi:hypothetical protein
VLDERKAALIRALFAFCLILMKTHPKTKK